VPWLERAWASLDALLSPPLVIGLSAFSIVTCVVSVVVASWAVRRLPADYLLHEPERARGSERPSLALIARNLAGGLLVLLGLVLIPLPGQGVLTILAGLALMDFRGKRRVEHWLMLRPAVFAAINHSRVRAGRPRLVQPAPRAGESGHA
jgi:hypothetical protein